MPSVTMPGAIIRAIAMLAAYKWTFHRSWTRPVEDVRETPKAASTVYLPQCGTGRQTDRRSRRLEGGGGGFQRPRAGNRQQ